MTQPALPSHKVFIQEITHDTSHHIIRCRRYPVSQMQKIVSSKHYSCTHQSIHNSHQYKFPECNIQHIFYFFFHNYLFLFFPSCCFTFLISYQYSTFYYESYIITEQNTTNGLCHTQAACPISLLFFLTLQARFRPHPPSLSWPLLRLLRRR